MRMLRFAHTSDLHLDQNRIPPEEGGRWVAEEALRQGAQALLLGGDLASDLGLWERAVRAAASLGLLILVVPGNHCLWSESEGCHQGWRHEELLVEACLRAGAHPLWMEPLLLDGVLFAGSYGHYDRTLGGEAWEAEPLSDAELRRARWPHARQPDTAAWNAWHDFALAHTLRLRLDRQLSRFPSPPRARVCLLHTVPFARGVVWREADPDWNSLNPKMGSRLLGDLLVERGVDLVLYGHTHSPREFFEQGVRAVNSAVGTRRRDGWSQSPEARLRASVRLSTL